MGKRINLEFDYMKKANVVAHVKVYEGGEITCERFTDDVIDNPLPFGNNGPSLSRFFLSRCFPETRANKDELLKFLGLRYYAPLSIVKKTRGQQNDDFYWLRFKGDTAKWDDIKLRD